MGVRAAEELEAGTTTMGSCMLASHTFRASGGTCEHGRLSSKAGRIGRASKEGRERHQRVSKEGRGTRGPAGEGGARVAARKGEAPEGQ